MRSVLIGVLVLWSLGATHRSTAARDAFKQQTGYPHGRPGFVIDHRIPLCAGGVDAPSNMAWQSIADARRKDRFEKALCAELRRQGYTLVKQ